MLSSNLSAQHQHRFLTIYGWARHFLHFQKSSSKAYRSIQIEKRAFDQATVKIIIILSNIILIFSNCTSGSSSPHNFSCSKRFHPLIVNTEEDYMVAVLYCGDANSYVYNLKTWIIGRMMPCREVSFEREKNGKFIICYFFAPYPVRRSVSLWVHLHLHVSL